MTAPADVSGAVFFRRAYLPLTLGAAAAGVAFLLSSGLGEYVDSAARMFLFLLWIEAPFALVAVNIFITHRYIYSRGNGFVFLKGVLLFLGAGALVYGRALSLPGGQVMDRNIIFLTGPFYHFAAAVAVTAGFMARCLYLAAGAGRRAGS